MQIQYLAVKHIAAAELLNAAIPNLSDGDITKPVL